MIQRGNPELPIHLGQKIGKSPAHGLKRARIGPLETINRLFGITDNKESADPLGPAVACKKLLRQQTNDLPLVGVRVLCLVDQNMIQPAVELEQYPRNPAVAAQQLHCMQNKIVVIQPGAMAFHRRIDRQNRRPQPDQGGTTGENRRPAHSLLRP